MPYQQWFPVAVAATAIAVYLNTLLNAFVWDDLYLVVDNTHIKSLTSIPGLFTEALFPRTQYYRPLQAFTFAFDYRVWGLAAGGFHLTSALLHAAVAWMFYRLAARILRDPLAGVAAALLFAVHPLHTEAIAYLSGRSDPLAALGGGMTESCGSWSP
jgi:hypothetical protein